MFGLAFIKYIPGTLSICQSLLPCGLMSDLPSHPERKSIEGGSLRTWFCDVEWQSLWQGQVPLRICMGFEEGTQVSVVYRCCAQTLEDHRGE